MQKTHHCLTDSQVSVNDLERYAQGWLLDGEIRQLSKNTLTCRRSLVSKLLWFLRQREYPVCGTNELRAFLAYASNGHEDEAGRWGNPRMTRKVKPRTIKVYYIDLRTLFNFLLAEGVISSSPIATLKPPIVRSDQIQPFTQEQVSALLLAAKKSRHPKRDEAILFLLLDTGMRASELCTLKRKDIDLQGRRCTVLGKGNKTRNVYFGGTTAKALWNYLTNEPRGEDAYLFVSDRGATAGDCMQRNGLLRLIMRLGKAAKIEAARCSPHTFRHTFAVEFLRAGGNTFTLQTLLGHTSLVMTNRYVALAEADCEVQHRQFSPADRLKRGERK